jgi:hypothetical protein
MAVSRIEGAEKLRKKLRALGDALSGAILAEVSDEMALLAQREVQLKAPVDTGAYRGSIRTEEGPRTATSAESSVVTDAAQAFALEFGSGLHAERGPKEKYPIEPDEKKALFWPGAAHPVFRVMHPGIEAQPHFRPAIRDKGPKIVEHARKLLEKHVNAAAKS